MHTAYDMLLFEFIKHQNLKMKPYKKQSENIFFITFLIILETFKQAIVYKDYKDDIKLLSRKALHIR